MHELHGSSSIKGIDMKDSTLTVHFRSGKSYVYEDVPHLTMWELLKAKSPGGYFAKRIRPHFTGTLLTEDEEPE